jgi:hypothetical protein
MKALSALLLLALFSAPVKADSVGPTWNIIASGTFSGHPGGLPPAESFNLDWTVSFIDASSVFLPGFVEPLVTGTISFAGVLGPLTSTLQAAPVTFEKGGAYIPFFLTTGQAEIDVPTAYLDRFIPSAQMFTAPSLNGTPYVYSCLAPSPCQDYGSGTGIGLFVGDGQVTQEAFLVTEPSTSLLLFVGMFPLILAARGTRLRSKPT